ncbi:MAG: hypothetical protein MR335_05440, partial [Bacilli bacterium]|nr:hypothetical protein [Bacilli bacterium]MDD7181607.1 hypothetical protein [Bacilli bacterium]
GPIAKPALTEALPNVLNHWFGKANYTFFWKTPQYFDYSPLQFTISRNDIRIRFVLRSFFQRGFFFMR